MTDQDTWYLSHSMQQAGVWAQPHGLIQHQRPQIHTHAPAAALTLATVAPIVASTRLLLLHTLVLRLAHKPPRLAALIGVLAGGALAALVVGLVGAAVALVCVQAQHGTQAEGACLLAVSLLCALLPGLAALLPLGNAGGLLVL